MILLRGRNYAPADLEQALDSPAGGAQGLRGGGEPLPGQREPGKRATASCSTSSWSGRKTKPAAPPQRADRSRPGAHHPARGDRPPARQGDPLEPGTLPRTSSGKLRRRETLRLYLAGELAPPAKVTPFLLLGAWLRSRLAFRRAGKRANGGRPPANGLVPTC